MDFNTILQAVGSVGFPIVCCIYLIVTQKEMNSKNAEALEKMRQTVENNTLAMTKLSTKLGIDLED